jgi:ribonuclease P/MRP protein subunit POP5
MVRLKHRYLLVNILYPESDTPTKPTTKDGKVPDVVSFRRPSSDKLNAQLLARMIRDGVADLFGDYGSGMIASSLVGEFIYLATSNREGI